MFWRVPSSGHYWTQNKGAPNREAFKLLVCSGEARGLLAFSSGIAIGWCSLGPREQFAYLSRARKIGPAPGPGTWSVTCFFVRRNARRSGIASRLLQAAVAYAREQGADWLEGYPSTVPADRLAPDAFIHTGTASLFLASGFMAAGDPGSRTIYRLKLLN